MKRRHFLHAALAAAPASLAAPALAQSQPALRWRLMSGFTQNFDIFFSAASQFARLVLEATDGQFRIETYASGELAPGAMTFDWTMAGTVEMSHLLLENFAEKQAAFHLASAMPFGLDAPALSAWFAESGTRMLNDLLEPLQLYALPLGLCGAQMAGWFKSPIAAPQDLKGRSIRASGLGAKLWSALGAQPQTLSRDAIAPAFANGTCDAAEFFTLYDDEKIGLSGSGLWLYYPSISRNALQSHLLIHLPAWNKLPKSYQTILANAAASIQAPFDSRYRQNNVQALKRIISAGTHVEILPQQVLEAAFNASKTLLEDQARQSPAFEKMLASQRAFLDASLYLDQTAAYAAANFAIRHRLKG